MSFGERMERGVAGWLRELRRIKRLCSPLSFSNKSVLEKKRKYVEVGWGQEEWKLSRRWKNAVVLRREIALTRYIARSSG